MEQRATSAELADFGRRLGAAHGAALVTAAIDAHGREKAILAAGFECLIEIVARFRHSGLTAAEVEILLQAALKGMRDGIDQTGLTLSAEGRLQ